MISSFNLKIKAYEKVCIFRATEYSGNLFGSGGGIDVSLNDTWEHSYSAEW